MEDKLEKFLSDQDDERFKNKLDLRFYTNFDWFQSDYLDFYRRDFKKLPFVEYLGNYYNFYNEKYNEFSLFFDEKEDILNVMKSYKEDITEMEDENIDLQQLYFEISHEIGKIRRFLDKEIFTLTYDKLDDKKKLKKEENKNPVKIKILDELGLLAFLNQKGYTKSQYEFFLSILFDIGDKQVRNIINRKNDSNTEKALEIINEIKNKKSVRS